MKREDLIAVRIYITESSNQEDKIIHYLQKEINIQGISVFRAVSGYGKTGTHKTTLLDLSLDLPLVIEFFDYEDKANVAIKYLSDTMELRHVISWPVSLNKK